MNKFAFRFVTYAAVALCCLQFTAGAAQDSSPIPDAMATQPDPREFITRADTSLSTQGNPFRFGGMNISWLSLRDDTGRPEDARRPTDFELGDIFKTVQVLGAGFIRATSVAASAGCAQCLAPSAGQIGPDALSFADHLLKITRDAGLKIVLPLAGDGHCPAAGPLDPTAGLPCLFARARGMADTAFFSDPRVRDDFAKHVTALLTHINPETGLAWKDDPTILAWENCDGCGAGVDAKMLADWTEFLGRTIKAVDPHHLYENGAFALHLSQLDASLLALPSVDVVGDRVASAPSAQFDNFYPAQQAVTRAGRVYLIDSYTWGPASWATPDDFQLFLMAIVKNRSVSGAFLDDLGGHADRGGWLPPTRPGRPTLYFPAAQVGSADVMAMEARARAVRRFSYSMMDLLPASFATPDPPQVISVTHGKVAWRGSPGAIKYSISRSSDLTQIGSWTTLCDQCATDADPQWQDPSTPGGDVWYRVTPYNPNFHAGMPSDPTQNK